MSSITINEAKNLLIIKNHRIPLITPDKFETLYFQLNSLADALGYEAPDQANKLVKSYTKTYRKLKHEFPNITVLPSKNILQTYFINEIGLFKLLITSRKPFAKKLFLKMLKFLKTHHLNKKRISTLTTQLQTLENIKQTYPIIVPIEEIDQIIKDIQIQIS